MKPETQTRIVELAEHLYRIANFPPEFRDDPLTEMDQVGLTEVIQAVDLAMREQDKITRHACAEAVSGIDILTGPFADHITAREAINRAHAACMNTQAV